jgi:hypothetical protein
MVDFPLLAWERCQPVLGALFIIWLTINLLWLLIMFLLCYILLSWDPVEWFMESPYMWYVFMTPIIFVFTKIIPTGIVIFLLVYVPTLIIRLTLNLAINHVDKCSKELATEGNKSISKQKNKVLSPYKRRSFFDKVAESFINLISFGTILLVWLDFKYNVIDPQGYHRTFMEIDPWYTILGPSFISFMFVYVAIDDLIYNELRYGMATKVIKCTIWCLLILFCPFLWTIGILYLLESILIKISEHKVLP